MVTHEGRQANPNPLYSGLGVHFKMSRSWHWVLAKYVLVSVALTLLLLALRAIVREVPPSDAPVIGDLPGASPPSAVSNTTKKPHQVLLGVASVCMLLLLIVQLVAVSTWRVLDTFYLNSSSAQTKRFHDRRRVPQISRDPTSRPPPLSPSIQQFI